jgi:hypothetical protein
VDLEDSCSVKIPGYRSEMGALWAKDGPATGGLSYVIYISAIDSRKTKQSGAPGSSRRAPLPVYAASPLARGGVAARAAFVLVRGKLERQLHRQGLVTYVIVVAKLPCRKRRFLRSVAASRTSPLFSATSTTTCSLTMYAR